MLSLSSHGTKLIAGEVRSCIGYPLRRRIWGTAAKLHLPPRCSYRSIHHRSSSPFAATTSIDASRLVQTTTTTTSTNPHSVVHDQRSSLQQKRFKHRGSKKGLELQKLAEMGNAKQHEEAVERRAKQKQKKAARKGNKRDDLDPANNSAALAAFQEEVEDDSWADDESDEEEEDEEDIVELPDVEDVKERMLKHVESLKDYLRGVRGGSPTAELFDNVVVQDAYGKDTGSTPLKSLAQVVIASPPTMAQVMCFDPATAKAVVIAIRDTLDLNPNAEDAGTIKVPLPRVSLESRQQTSAAVQRRVEGYRKRIRNNRRKAMSVVKEGVAGRLDGISKDDAYRVQQEIEAMTSQVTETLDQIAEDKIRDIMAV